MKSGIRSDRRSRILELVHDPRFVDFELLQEAPSIFNAVGRTHTETWHSALLGWLLDPASSHRLGVFPLKRFLLLCRTHDSVERQIDVNQLIAKASFSTARARPNEREPFEVSVPNLGRFDILVDGIQSSDASKRMVSEIQLLIEIKVKGKIEKDQCVKYIGYTKTRMLEGVFILPIYIAPSSQFEGKSKRELLGDDIWITLSYQNIYDDVIEPCLNHPSISEFGRFTLTEYVKTLKFRPQGGYPLIITEEERELVEALMEDHAPAIQSLFEILSQTHEEFSTPTPSAGRVPNPIRVKINGQLLEQPSIPKLYRQVLEFLCDGAYLNNLELPIASSAKRYLIATEPTHPRGNRFFNPVEYKGYYIEAHKSRDTGLHELGTLFETVGIPYEVVD